MSAATVTELTTASFDAVVTNPSQPVLVKFFAPWCAPCRSLAAVFADLAGQYAGRVVFAEVNIDEESELAARLGIRSVPTVLLFQGGSTKPVHGIEAATGDDIEMWLSLIAPG